MRHPREHRGSDGEKTSVAPTRIHVVLRSSVRQESGAACGAGAARGSSGTTRGSSGSAGSGGGTSGRSATIAVVVVTRRLIATVQSRPTPTRRRICSHLALVTPPQAGSPTSRAPGLFDPKPVSPPGRKLRDAPDRGSYSGRSALFVGVCRGCRRRGSSRWEYSRVRVTTADGIFTPPRLNEEGPPGAAPPQSLPCPYEK